MKQFTLADAIKLGGDRDITDNTYDCLNYFDYSEEPHDSYDRVMLWFAENIIVTGGDRDVIHCNITEFIEKNMMKFKRFAKHIYNDWYYNEQFKLVKNTLCEEFYDTYLQLFFDMINGGLATEDYQWFVENIIK